MKRLLSFISNTLALNQPIQTLTQGRIYCFETTQGTHTYPIVFWRIITQEAVAKDLSSVGEAFKAEVQIDAFTEDAGVSASLANIIFNQFNNAPQTDGILDCYADEIVPVFERDDQVVQYAVRVIVHFLQQ